MKFSIYSAFLALLFWQCAPQRATVQPGSGAGYPSVRQLVRHFPADNGLEQGLLSRTLLEMGPDSLAVCFNLLEGDESIAGPARYAVSGLVLYAGKFPEHTAQRTALQKLILQRFTQSSSPDVRRFLLDQLKWIAGDVAVPFLGRLLADKRFAGRANRLLTNIGSKTAGRALYTALINKTTADPSGTIQALGSLRFRKSAGFLMTLAGEDNNPLQALAIRALTDMGHIPVQSLIEQKLANHPLLADDLLHLADRLREKDQTTAAKAIYQKLFADDSLPGQMRSAALSGLVKLPGQESFQVLRAGVFSADRRLRAAALRLAAQSGDAAATHLWIASLDEADPPLQAELIEMLARRGDSSALPAILTRLNHSSNQLRAAAWQGLARLDQQRFLEALPGFLSSGLSESDRTTLAQIFDRLPAEIIVDFMRRYFEQLNSDAQILLFEALHDRKPEVLQPFILRTLSTADPQVRARLFSVLAETAGDSLLPDLFSKLDQLKDRNERRALLNLITDIAKKSDRPAAVVDQLKRHFERQPDSLKIGYLKVFKAIGGNASLQTVVAQLGSENQQVSETALRTLAAWPDRSALNALMEHIETANNLTHQVLCLRGLVRLLQDEAIPTARVIDYARKMLDSRLRADEKRMVLGLLAGRPGAAALELAAGYLSDPELGQDALAAIMKITESSTEEVLSRKELALLLLDNRQVDLPASLQDQIGQLSRDAGIPRPPEGFSALFNGYDLTGWKGLVADPPRRAKMSPQELAAAQAEADERMRRHWRVIDGVLYFDGQGESLCTLKDYKNFELLLDWKIEKDGDSGIYLRGTPQVQIWDAEFHPEGSGGLYNNQKNPRLPLVRADRPAGQWNHFHIIMRDQRVTVFLNDVLVTDNVILENYWEREKTIYPVGQIELQAHFHPLYFRNIFIREIADDELPFEGALFNGRDLDGWQVVGNTADSWKVQDSILFTEGHGGGWLATIREFADFELSLEFRVSPGGNSGVFLRSPLSGDPAYTGMEFQVLDDYAEQYSRLKRWQYTASLYGLQPPSARVTRAAGQWQKMQITCRGPKVQVVLNDSLINDVNLIDYMEHTDSHPGIKRRKGHIGLQNHSSRVEYRNIYLRELPAD